jgi:hypothetical protein
MQQKKSLAATAGAGMDAARHLVTNRDLKEKGRQQGTVDREISMRTMRVTTTSTWGGGKR